MARCPACGAPPWQRCRRRIRASYGTRIYELAWTACHRPRRVAAGLESDVCRACRRALPSSGGAA